MTPRATTVFRFFVLGLLLVAIGVVAYMLLRDPKAVRQTVHSWVNSHRLAAPAIYICVYIALAVLALPLWWLQMIAGYTFGLLGGVLWSQIAAGIAAPLIVLLSRWLAADWFHKKIESKMEKLRVLDEKLGHNGFLVVMAIRLTHVMPFGLSNYALGLTRIPLIDVAVGTLLGGIPTVTLYVLLGFNPRLLEDWRYIVGIAMLNVALIIPVALRYLKPEWFKRLGLE
jgi:uncharacterized membrane protein YdjX (TVP38/TMEM64 family)